MNFRLHSSRGSALPGLVSASGIDVDNGELTATPLWAVVRSSGDTGSESGTQRLPVYFVKSKKCIRFTDLLAEQPVISNVLGRGLLNLLTPALLALWMRELIDTLYDREQELARAQERPALTALPTGRTGTESTMGRTP
jgi:hypothetical protein